MPIYAIGDVQGCFDSLKKLLTLIQFNPDRDQLWFTGDIVNRGPASLETLRFIKDLGDNAITVLGNHDLHLLAVAYGHRKIHHTQDTFHKVIKAPDFDDLIDWLRNRPLLHHDTTNNFTMVHAGLPPQWNLTRAQKCANEVQQVLRSHMVDSFLANMYGNKPDLWSDNLRSWDRLRYITNSFTRIRYCDKEGREDFKSNRQIGTQPGHLMPWFHLPDRKNKELKIIFGHWAALGLHLENNIYSLDSGCVWGGKLTAMRLQHSPAYFQVECRKYK